MCVCILVWRTPCVTPGVTCKINCVFCPWSSNCLLNKVLSNHKWNWLLVLLESDSWNWLLVSLKVIYAFWYFSFFSPVFPSKKKKKTLRWLTMKMSAIAAKSHLRASNDQTNEMFTWHSRRVESIERYSRRVESTETYSRRVFLTVTTPATERTSKHNNIKKNTYDLTDLDANEIDLMAPSLRLSYLQQDE